LWEGSKDLNIPEEEKASRKQADRLGYQLSKMITSITSLRRTPTERKNLAKIQSLNKKNKVAWNEFKNAISELETNQWSSEVRTRVVDRLHTFQQADYVRQWLQQEDNDFIDEMVDQLSNRAMTTKLTELSSVKSINRVTKTGGIDLTSPAMLQIRNGNEGGINFHIDPVLLKRLQNVSGFEPVILNIQPLINLEDFLGVKT
jgi:hypothetical protein